MKPLLVLLFIAFLIANKSSGQSAKRIADFDIDSFFRAQQAAALGKPFPAFKVSMNGPTVTNQLMRGKVVLVNFWFEGCLPCLVEMEALDELQQALKGHKDFLFLSFTKDGPEAVKRVKAKYRLSFPVLAVSDKDCKRLSFGNGYPTSMILDRKGKIRYLHSGGATNKELAREFVMKELLAEVKCELAVR